MAAATGRTATQRVTAAYRRIEQVGRPEVWITLRPEDEVLAEAAAVDPALPLAGLVFAVKDNIDVAGLPTTAAAPSYAYRPESDATAVDRLRRGGAVVIGKTNMDQFATGLVGTRSPYGAVRNAWDPARISGGSSSGSAVAVALGIVDFALGTDTAGSGRVPAALNGIVGIKPTKGLVPLTGVVPACYTQDCVSVFACDLTLAALVQGLMVGPDPADPLSRVHDGAGQAPPVPSLAVPKPGQLTGLADGWAEAFDDAVRRFAATGAEIVEVDIAPLLRAAELLYGGAFLAERYDAVGGHIEKHADLIGTDLDPTVARIILAGKGLSAAQWARDTATVARLAAEGRSALADHTALLTPTTTGHPTLAQVAADPVGANARLGRYTNFANLLDMASLGIPAGEVDGMPFGVMLTAPAFRDHMLTALAQRFAAPDLDLFVVGAHLTGQPLNGGLVRSGGRPLGPARTAARYRLYALGTQPPKPGLVRAVGDTGTSIEGELWRLPAAGFGTFVAAVPPPMVIGTVELDDGRAVSGFLAEPYAIDGAPDISEFGGWRPFLTAGRPFRQKDEE